METVVAERSEMGAGKPRICYDKITMDKERAFLTEQEAAELLRVSRKTLWRFRRRGLPSYKLGEGRACRRLYIASEIITWVKETGKG